MRKHGGYLPWWKHRAGLPPPQSQALQVPPRHILPLLRCILAGLLHHCPLGDYQTGWDWHRGCIKPMRNSSTVGDVVVVFLACRLGYSWIGWHFGIWGEWIGDNCTYVSVVVETISDNGSNGLWGWCRERSVNGLSWSKVFSDTHCVSVCKLEGWCPLCSLPYLCGGVMLISLHCHIHVPC